MVHPASRLKHSQIIVTPPLMINWEPLVMFTQSKLYKPVVRVVTPPERLKLFDVWIEVDVGVAVSVQVGESVGVAVGVRVPVSTAVGVRVAVSTAVDVKVAVSMAVVVKVGVLGARGTGPIGLVGNFLEQPL